MKYILMCQNCGQKHFADGSNTSGLTEIQTAPIPKAGKETQNQVKKFKCYNCGMVFKITKIEEKVDKPKTEEEFQDFESDSYFRKWENEILRSARKRK